MKVGDLVAFRGDVGNTAIGIIIRIQGIFAVVQWSFSDRVGRNLTTDLRLIETPQAN